MKPLAETIGIITLDEKYTNCALCGEETPLGWSVPMYEGKIVDPTKTDDWAGMPVCSGCYNK
jgi:hypothetical protein